MVGRLKSLLSGAVGNTFSISGRQQATKIENRIPGKALGRVIWTWKQTEPGQYFQIKERTYDEQQLKLPDEWEVRA
jgi:hypothetical protein